MGRWPLDDFSMAAPRPSFFGWVSDTIGREHTMFIAFGFEGIGIFLLYLWGSECRLNDSGRESPLLDRSHQREEPLARAT